MTLTLIFIAGFVTFLTRFLLIAFIDPKKLSFTIKKILMYVPSAVFPAIIFPAVFLNKNGFFINLYSPQVLAFIVAIIIGYYTKNVILTILGGLISYWVLIYFFNQV